jgi:hypothetical protein
MQPLRAHWCRLLGSIYAMEEGNMRRLLALIAVVALMVAFALPMAGTAEAASHGDKMNPCQAKSKAKEMKKANPCGKTANPCGQTANPCGKTANPCGMKDKAEKTMGKGKETMDEGKKMMDKTKSQ